MEKFNDLTLEELKSEAIKISSYLLDTTKEISKSEMTIMQEEFDRLVELINSKQCEN